MKTPRQILFDRHRAAETKLDAVRQKVLASIAPAATSRCAEGNHAPGFFPSLRAVLQSLRWHIAGLSAVWALIVLLRVASDGAPAPTLAQQSAPQRQLLMALRENRRQLLELIESPADAVSPAPPAVVAPRRSEIQLPTAMA